MRTPTFLGLPVRWASTLLLTAFLAVASPAQRIELRNTGTGLSSLLESFAPPARQFLPRPAPPPLQYQVSVAHTRPELANRPPPTEIPSLRPGTIMGSDGVAQGERRILPFGTKGEKVALAFLSGEYTPPEGEKLQPALAQLARQRAEQLSAQGAGVQPTVYALILLNGRLDEGLQAWLEERGVKLLGFYPYTAYQARIPVAQLAAVAQHPQVRWVGQPYPVQKLDPDLRMFMGDTTGERIWLYVNLFGHDEAAREAIAGMVERTGVYDPSLGVFAVVADAATVNRLLDMDAVLFVEPIRLGRPAHTESQGSINADLIWYYGRSGGAWEGTKVGVMDSGLSFHWDFGNIWSNTAGYNRTTEGGWWDDLHGHGTHVTGTLLGEGNALARYRGTASGLRDTGHPGYDLLVSKVFRRLPDGSGGSEGDSVYRGLLDMQAPDARGDRQTVYTRQVFNFSGGREGDNLLGTDAESRKVDQMFQWSILPVIAAGNEGPGSGTISSPGVAKGALTVGAVYDDELGYGAPGYVDRITNYSSRGPTGDYRRKPDVVAPGSWIDSCSNEDDSGYKYNFSGTSMATPHVAGLATTIIGQFGNYNLYAWVTKAIILANAINMGYPDAMGFGKVDAMLCHFDVDGWWSVWWGGNYLTGDRQSFTFSLPYDASLLQVVLVYPDAPAPSGAAWALVNDLDLYLYGPGASWVSTSPSDNVESVRVRNVPAGEYRVEVYTYAHRDSADPWQDWAVAVRAVYGPLEPNLMLSLSTPVAVQPNVPFDVEGSVYAGSYVASGVYGKIDLPPDITLAHMTFYRFAPDGAEESFGLTDREGINQGNIPAGFTRRLVWNVAAANEGVYDIGYTVTSSNGGTASTSSVVVVDGTPPGDWWWWNYPSQWAWTSSPYADGMSVRAQDSLSGLNTGALYCWYWHPNLGTVGPLPCTTDAQEGTTEPAWIIVPEGLGVDPYAMFRFGVYDRAGNYAESNWYTLYYDGEPPGEWQNFAITGFSADGQKASCKVEVRDGLSGLDPRYGYYHYSTDGGSTWSFAVPASTTGAYGSTGWETMTAAEVPINPQGAPATQVRFYSHDIAGNLGGSPVFHIPSVSRRVSGTLYLQNFIGNPSGIGATLEIRLPGSTTPVETYYVTLDSEGRYTLQTRLHGTYDVAAKASHWLRKVHPVIALTGDLTLDFDQINGDIDGDNEVTLFDFGHLVAAFGSMIGDSNWNPKADLDGDMEVTLFDFGILVSNFGMVGDE